VIEKLKQLAELRAKLDYANQEKESAKQIVEMTLEWSTYLGVSDAAKIIGNAIGYLEQEIKEDSVKAFDGTKKRPYDGIEIKAFTITKITDERVARDWAMKNYTPALKLDTKAIEKAGKEGLTPDGLVIVETEYRAQIASDLSAYLLPVSSEPKGFIPRFLGDSPELEASHQ